MVKYILCSLLLNVKPAYLINPMIKILYLLVKFAKVQSIINTMVEKFNKIINSIKINGIVKDVE